jgi:transcriptional regulator with XRE-family HTH domain
VGVPNIRVGFSAESYIARVRKSLYEHALDLAGGSQSEAARLLGVTPQAVSEFLKGGRTDAGLSASSFGYARQLYNKSDLPAGDFDAHFTFAQTLSNRRSSPVRLCLSLAFLHRRTRSAARAAKGRWND